MKKSIILLAIGAAAGIVAYKKMNQSGTDVQLLNALSQKIDTVKEEVED